MAEKLAIDGGEKTVREPLPGWPKFTGAWLIANPVIADLDGDGRATVLVATRTGHLFAWNTPGAIKDAPWPQYGRTAQRSGGADMRFEPRPAPPKARSGCTSSDVGMGGGFGLTLLLGLALVRRHFKLAARKPAG